jgi:Na+-transporting NADH:ubiquinone oxidoreductase subunit NqrC
MLATNQQALARIDKKEDAILKATGINASHTTSIHVQNIFNDNSKTLISSQVTDLLGNQLDSIIDAEYDEIEETDE